ncbi:unnamed protein product, partial [Gongylonema pulchrum]|uniref:DUF4757 domain-containing protein n=1 Tax=Gongylonema pulchrum TaxID=637853 RepID=A0A183DMW5_9BILA
YYVNSISTEDEDEDEIVTEVEHEDDDRTPVLSRENSNVQNKPTTPTWQRKTSGNGEKTDEVQVSLMRVPSIYSNTSRKNATGNNENIYKRGTDWKLWREVGVSPPCRRKIEGSPASVRRSVVTLEGSPSSERKSASFDPGSPMSLRKSSTISTTPSVRSDSTLQTSASPDASCSHVPESPILLRRGSSRRAEVSSVLPRKTTNCAPDSGIHFASPLPARRKESENGVAYSPLTRRKDSDVNSPSPVI